MAIGLYRFVRPQYHELMKSEHDWQPTKYVMRRGRLMASRDPTQVGTGSRVIANAVAACYQKHLPVHARGRLIDLGCGFAPLYATYRPHASEITCVDWENSLHPSPYLDNVADLNARLPFPDGCFDTVILSDVLEHVAEPTLLWSEMTRLLAPGGKVLVNTPFMYRIHEAPHDYARYTEFALRRFADECGLEVMLLEAVGGSFLVLMDFVGKHLEQAGMPGRWLAAMMAAIAGWTMRARVMRRIERVSSAAFPLGYFMVARKPHA